MAFVAEELDVSDNTGSTASCTLDSAPASGQLIVGFINCNDQDCTFTPSQSWDGNGSRQPTGETGRHFWFRKIAGASEPTTYTVDIGISTSWQMHVAVFSATDAIVFDDATAGQWENGSQTNDLKSDVQNIATLTGQLGVLSSGFDNRGTGSTVYDGFEGGQTGWTAGIGSEYGRPNSQALGFAWREFASDITPTGLVNIDPNDSAPTDGTTFSYYLRFSESAGGTEFTQTVAGTLGLAGLLPRQAGKGVTGSLLPVGAVPRGVDKSVVGSVEPAGTLPREVSKGVVGSVEPAGTLPREVGKGVVGSVDPSGGLVSTTIITRTLAGAVSFAGVISRLTAKRILGAFAPSGASNKVTSRSVTGLLSASGEATKETQASHDGSVAPSGTVDRVAVASRDLAGSLTPTGAISRFVSKLLGGSVTPEGAATKQTSVSSSGSVAPGGAVTKETQISPSGSVTPEGEALTGAETEQTVEGEVSFAGAVSSFVFETVINVGRTILRTILRPILRDKDRPR